MTKKKHNKNANFSCLKISPLKSNGNEKKSAFGSRFDVLHEVEDRTFSKGEDHLRKTEVATTTWRRKEGKAPPSIKGGVIEPKKRIESTESGSKEDVVDHTENEQLNLGTDGKRDLVTVEPHLEPSTEIEVKEKVTKVKEKKGKATKNVEPRLEPSTEIERQEKVTEVKEKEGKATDVPVGKPVILSQATHEYNLRPNGLSSMRNKKKATRAHNVVFRSTKTIKSSKGEKKRPPIEDKYDGLASKNGYQDEQAGKPLNVNKNSSLENVLSQDGQLGSNEHKDSAPNEQNSKESPVGDTGRECVEEPSKETQKPSVESTEQNVSSAEQFESTDIEMMPVELIGSLDSIEKAKELISAVIAKLMLGGSEQIHIQVPNEKVGLIIRRGGETIKGLQTKFGAHIQRNLIGEATAFLLDMLKPNLHEHGHLQTKVL
ncbi:hypothetical protein K1719_014796 [Acacia pycnantha]|nr:hypothetical protein K1719_014796 [Acacia pycnantha]